MSPRLLVGLGNPGADYEGTRHNLGFLVVDRLAAEANSRWLKRGRSLLARGEGFLLAKPQTFMNLSGRAVRELLDELGPDTPILVACDDFHLPLGRLRCRAAGSSGGQKGLQSVLDALPGSDVARLRLGVGEPVGMAPEDYVLQPFRASERPAVDDMLARAAALVGPWLADGDLPRLIQAVNAPGDLC